MEGIVYTLSCPIEKKVKYVGVTTKGLDARLAQHIHSPSRKNKVWVDKLKEQNLAPIIEPLEEVSGEKSEIYLAEKYWINQLTSWGFKLTNQHTLVKYKYVKRLELRFFVSEELYQAILESANKNMRTIGKEVEFQLSKIFKIEL